MISSWNWAEAKSSDDDDETMSTATKAIIINWWEKIESREGVVVVTILERSIVRVFFMMMFCDLSILIAAMMTLVVSRKAVVYSVVTSLASLQPLKDLLDTLSCLKMAGNGVPFEQQMLW